MKIKTIAILAISFSTSLLSQSNSIRNKFYIEGSFAKGLNYPTRPYNIDSSLMSKENNIPNQGNVFGLYTSHHGTDEQKLASLYAFENSPKGKINGQTYSLFFEYIFNSGIGLGFGLNSANFQAKDIANPKNGTMFELGYLSRLNPNFEGYPMNQVITYEILTPYQTYSDNDFLHIRFANIQLAYHFLQNSIFDPYIRVGAGLGIERFSKATIFQSNLTLGTRIFLTERLYIVIEAVGTNYDAKKKIQSPTITNLSRMKEEHIWSLQEYSAKIGLGVNF